MSQINPYLTPIDQLLVELGHALKSTLAPTQGSKKPNPAGDIVNQLLSEDELKLSTGLMRINHTGEVAAQALYRGQALVARSKQQKCALLAAADEEQDHLLWCQQRLDELGGSGSKLAPTWYLGSFIIGVTAGFAGDGWSLGFVEETENQVSAHLDEHLERLPKQDQRSRAIVLQMREDEARHAEAAHAAGAIKLPQLVKSAMGHTANIMRFISFRL